MSEPARRPLTFGVLINEIEGTYQTLAMRGLSEVARELNVNLFGFPGHIPADRMDYEREFNVIYRLAAFAPVDGLIVFPQTFDWSMEEGGLTRMLSYFGNVPAVCVGSTRTGLSWFNSDHRVGMEALVDHFLHDHGYRRIAFIKGASGNADGQERLAAFLERHAAAGVPVDPALMLEGQFVPYKAAAAMDDLLDRGIAFDAVIAANDEMALAAMSRALRRGIRVPEHMAIAGYDDVAGQTGMAVPLTSIDQDVPGLARRAMAHLVAQCTQGQREIRSEVMAPKLRLRNSCGCRGDQAPYQFGQLWADSHRGESMLQDLGRALRRDLEASAPLPGPPHEELPAAPRHFDHALRQHVAVGRTRQGSMADLRTAIQQLARQFYAEAASHPREWERALGAKLLEAHTVLHEQSETFQAEDTLRRCSRARSIWYVMQEMGKSGAYRLENIMEPLQQGLRQLGLKNALVVLYPEPIAVESWHTFEPPRQVRLAAGVVNNVLLRPDQLGTFPIEQFLPVSPFDTGGGITLSLFPLFLQGRQFGYLVMDLGEPLDTLFEQVRADVSSLVTSSTLVEEVAHAQDLVREDLGRQRIAARQLSQQAQRDELTGLLNRRGFLGHIAEIRRDNPGHDALLWLIDLDGLKQINDAHGHPAGDSALRAAAQVLEAAFHGTALVARLGGDEFAVFNYPASSRPPYEVEQHIQRLLQEHNRRSVQPWSVAFSLGHSALDACTGANIDDVFALADRRLYANKRARKSAEVSAAKAKPPC